MPRFSANIGFLWSQLPLLERIERAAAAGFAAVEMHWPYDTPAEEVRDACERHRVELLGINTVPGDTAKGEFGLGAVSGRETAFQAALDQSLAYCKASGATSIHAMAGNVPRSERGRARDVLAANLRAGVEKAERAGITLLLEPINPRDKPDYFYSTVAEAIGLIEEIGSDALRLMFDVYHVGVAEGDVIMKLRRYRDLIGHVQIAAVPSRAEPDEGEIAYGAVFDELDALGYPGWVGCEYRPRTTPEEGLGWIETLCGAGATPGR